MKKKSRIWNKLTYYLLVNDRYSQKWYRPIPNIRPDTAEYSAEYSADNWRKNQGKNWKFLVNFFPVKLESNFFKVGTYFFGSITMNF